MKIMKIMQNQCEDYKKLIEINVRIIKIMTIKEINVRIMKIIKILKKKLTIMKIIKI